ncbi:hypothetical protein ACQEUX_17310 [Micromonospora sp. CA-259024]|uniref:hypothetical protein n=1 Tax=Micromonospora sp. CA-259024 TaxID=3239965 RepID=UPI003D8AE635
MERGFGRVVFVSSETAVDTPLDMVHYGVTETALLAVASGLARRRQAPASRSTLCCPVPRTPRASRSTSPL